MTKWDERFMKLAYEVSLWSKDPSTKVGAILVKDNKVVATGYNGFPQNVADDPKRLNDRPTKYKMIIHAEMNALIQAGNEANESTIYIYGMAGPSCTNCTKHIIQAGVKRIVSRSGERPSRWEEDFTIADNMLEEAGIIYQEFDINFS